MTSHNLSVHKQKHDNLCDVCGGVLDTTRDVPPDPARLVVRTFFQCPGHPEQPPLHKYCLKCEQWKDIDGMYCKVCGTTLFMRQLNEPPVSEVWNGSVASTKQTEPLTFESLWKVVEDFCKEHPDTGKCWHNELITSKYLPPPDDKGTHCVCARCYKPFVIPGHMFETRKSTGLNLAMEQESDR